jgi:hypothetical protein
VNWCRGIGVSLIAIVLILSFPRFVASLMIL